MRPSQSETRALSSSATGASCSTVAPRTISRSRTSAPSLRRLEHAAELHYLGGDQGASTGAGGSVAVRQDGRRNPSSASWRRGRCSRAVTSTGRSCWAVDERYSYGVVAAPGFDSKSLPPRPIFIDRSRVVFQCFWLCLLPSQRHRAYLRGELTEGRSFHFGSLSLACERP